MSDLGKILLEKYLVCKTKIFCSEMGNIFGRLENWEMLLNNCFQSANILHSEILINTW